MESCLQWFTSKLNFIYIEVNHQAFRRHVIEEGPTKPVKSYHRFWVWTLVSCNGKFSFAVTVERTTTACQVIVQIPVKMRTCRSHFLGKSQIQLWKWGSPASSMTQLYHEWSILKSWPVYIEPVLKKSVAIAFITNPDWRQHFGTRTAEICHNLCDSCYSNCDDMSLFIVA